MTRIAYLFVLLTLTGCAEYCGERLGSLATLALYTEAPKNAKYTNELKRTLMYCPIPKDGVRQTPEISIHAAHVHLIVGDIESAYESLESTKYTMSKEQEFFLMSYAVVHENDNVFNLVLDAGLNPKSNLPGTGVTVLMDAAHAGPNAAARMRQLIDHGADPFSISDDGFSALDSAVIAKNDDAIDFMLLLIEQSAPSRLKMVENAISIADRIDEGRATSLRAWLDTQAGMPPQQ